MLWDGYPVKYDALNLKFTNKGDKEICDILTKRHQFTIRRLAQSNSEDVSQLIMNAFANEIDPHINYLAPSNAEQFNIEMNLSLEGVDVVLQMDDNYMIINSLAPSGPVAKTKAITVSDRVVIVGQLGKSIVNIIGWWLDDVVSLMKGPKVIKYT